MGKAIEEIEVNSLTMGNAEQYGDSQKLAARTRLASRYTVSDQPWFPWVANHLPSKTGDDEALNRYASLPFEAVNGRAADAAALPFEDESFDGAIAMHMLYHLPDPAMAVADMFRVLKPGGFLRGHDQRREQYAPPLRADDDVRRHTS